VAWSAIHLSDLSDAERASVLEETKLLSALHHPNLITQIVFWEEDDDAVLVTELHDAGNLKG
jgi:hypothetical protein